MYFMLGVRNFDELYVEGISSDRVHYIREQATPKSLDAVTKQCLRK